MLAPTGMLMCKESGLSSQTLTNTSHFLTGWFQSYHDFVGVQNISFKV